MSSWGKEYKWVVSDKGIGSESGADITEANIFKGNAYVNATKELEQNVEDEKDSELASDVAPKCIFEMMYIDVEDVPGYSRIGDIIDRCVLYLGQKGDADNPAIIRLAEARKKFLKKEAKIPVLKVSDYNTVGLVKDNFEGLMYDKGIRHKKGNTSGSFGYGKYAPYRLSELNTIIYASRAKNEGFKLGGRGIFSTFEDEDGIKKLNITLFGREVGNGQGCLPVTDETAIPELYRRKENGTDLYILGFEPQEGWEHLIAISTLDNFFYAIKEGKLEVEIRSNKSTIIIDNNTLPEQMNSYREYYSKNLEKNKKEISFTAPAYWDVLTDPNVEPIYFKDICGKGNAVFYFRLGQSDASKSVLEMRSTGMKIQEEHFKRIPDFCGLFVSKAEGRESEEKGRNLNKFLRSLETATHSSWNSDDADPGDEKEADEVLTKITKLIRDEVKKAAAFDVGRKIGAFGLGRFLSDNSDGNEKEESEEAFTTFRPVVIPKAGETKTISVKKKKKQRKTNGRGSGQGTKVVTGIHRNGGNPNPDNRHGTKIAKIVEIEHVVAPYNERTQSYSVAFTVPQDIPKMLVQASIVDEDNEATVVPPVVAREGENIVAIDGEYVILENVGKNERVHLDLRLRKNGRYSLRIDAYAEQ